MMNKQQMLLDTLKTETELAMAYIDQGNSAEAKTRITLVRNALIGMSLEFDLPKTQGGELPADTDTGPLAPVSPISASEAANLPAHDAKPLRRIGYCNDNGDPSHVTRHET